jgi:hypothetical protein
LFLLEGLEELEDNLTLEMEKEDLMDFNYDEEKSEISLHAITGNNHPNTMSLIGWIGSHKIIVLVDNGSTHNFLDSSSVGKKLKVSISREQRIKVKVTNGEEVVSEGKCMQIEVQLQKFCFTTDAYMIMLAGCDMVLGIQWLVSLGSIIWNFKVLTMEFTIANHTFLSQGLITPYLREESKLVGSKRESSKGLLLQLLDNVEEFVREPLGLKVEGCWRHLRMFLLNLKDCHLIVHMIMQSLLNQPVYVRPYKYPYFQNEEIEKIVGELLATGVIKPSQSPFSSPVLLVRKVDGSWHMCMDYRALNKETIKDKFPIPVIDELLDELHESRIFF